MHAGGRAGELFNEILHFALAFHRKRAFRLARLYIISCRAGYTVTSCHLSHC